MARKRKKGPSSPPAGGGHKDIRNFFIARPRPKTDACASTASHSAAVLPRHPPPAPPPPPASAVAVASSASGVGSTAAHADDSTAPVPALAPAARRRLNFSAPLSAIPDGENRRRNPDDGGRDQKIGYIAASASNGSGCASPNAVRSVGADEVSSTIVAAAPAAPCDAEKEVFDPSARGRGVIDLTVGADAGAGGSLARAASADPKPCPSSSLGIGSPRRRRVQSTLTPLLLSPRRPKLASRQPVASSAEANAEVKEAARSERGKGRRRPLPIPDGSVLAAPPDPSNPNDRQRLLRMQFERDAASALLAAATAAEAAATSASSSALAILTATAEAETSASAAVVNTVTSATVRSSTVDALASSSATAGHTANSAAAGGSTVDAPSSTAMEVTTTEAAVRAPEVYSSLAHASMDTQATTVSTATAAAVGKPRSVESVDEDPFGSIPDDSFIGMDRLLANSSRSHANFSVDPTVGTADRAVAAPNEQVKASGDDHDPFGGISDADLEDMGNLIDNAHQQQRHSTCSASIHNNTIREASFDNTTGGSAAPNVAPDLPLSVEQRRVATFGPHAPLSVRAGAGSGKTHTMVARAVDLCRRHGLDPSRILMLTFTNRAAREMEGRVALALLDVNGNVRIGLPTVKTFHSLAFSWIKRCWRACGMGHAPTILATKSKERHFMKSVIEARLDELRLERCGMFLGVEGGWQSASSWSWDGVIEAVQRRYPDEYNRALLEAGAEAEKKKPPPPPKKRKKKGAAEEEDDEVGDNHATEERIKADLANIIRSELRKRVYMELLGLNKFKDGKPVICDLARRWKADKDQCNFYLDLVRNARLRGHKYRDYLPEDGRTWRLYEEMQVRTGNVDFDKMLDVFVDLLRTNAEVNRRFRERHCYVIVDEYQDNSEVQSDLLLEVVTDGRVTVVGDDDQCIYAFRGASPGNFDRLREHYSASPSSSAAAGTDDALSRHRPLAEEVLVDNYRSTGNILRVGSAFLERCSNRDRGKVLRPTKEDGEPVEIWTCESPADQAERIVAAIRRRHDEDGVPWGEMACLFRCFQMGAQGLLYRALEVRLASCRIPYVLAGGKNIFERATVKDVMAYATLTLTGRRDHADDDAFVRVLNRPCRRLPKKVLEKIRDHQSSMEVTPPMCLEEAAMNMCTTGVGLSASQRKALKAFFQLLHELRIESTRKRLPELIKFIWKRTGLNDLYAKEKMKKKSKRRARVKLNGAIEYEDEDSDSSEDDFDDGESDSVEAQKQKKLASICLAQLFPAEVEVLIDLAQRHVEDWKKREEIAGASEEKCVSSLFHLARMCVIQRVDELPELPQDYLPQHLFDELYLPEGIGPPIVSSFLTDVALQMTVPDEQSGSTHDDRVTISTVHRAKGLEWTDVFVPYFNEGYMPTKYREEDSPSSRRHQNGCDARDGGRCNRGCTEYFNAMDAQQRGSTPEERHMDEERRLAHVAATRAKDRLVFVSLRGAKEHLTFVSFRDEDLEESNYKKSTFEPDLAQLPQSVVKIEEKDDES